MSSVAVAPEDRALSLILSSFKDLSISRASGTPPVSQLTLSNSDTVSGSNTIASYLSTLIPTFKNAAYTDLENAEIDQWLTLSQASPIPDSTLDALNDTLKFRTTILGEKFSIADVVVYSRVKDIVAAWTDEQQTGEQGRRHIVRWVDFVQNSPHLGLAVPEEEKVKIDASKILFYPKPEEGPKKEKKPAAAAAAVEGAAQKVKEAPKAAAAAATAAADAVVGGNKKKEKKEKPKREPPPPKAEPLISPSQLDLRVGHILHCRPHPNADSLFVSTIAMGDDPTSALITPFAELKSVLPEDVVSKYSPFPPCRTVCSGLNGLVPIEEMQNRKVVVVANLKPVTMRGIKSAAMVLAASPAPPPGAEPSHKKEHVELVAPPQGAETGEKVFFDGYDGTPEPVLNPKKKVWEQIQPGFATTDGLEVVFDRTKAGWTGEGQKGKAAADKQQGKLMIKNGGLCTVASVKDGNVS